MRPNEDLKKRRPLSDEELKKVSGGVAGKQGNDKQQGGKKV